MTATDVRSTKRTGIALGLRALLVLLSIGGAGCHTKPGQLPVDSPIYAFRAPDTDDDDSDSDSSDTSDQGSGSAGGAAAGSAKE